MDIPLNLTKIRKSLERRSAKILFRKLQKISSDCAHISFTFDDFPKTALRNGGKILQKYGLRGTFYTSFGLLGRESPSGLIAGKEDLADLLEEGHELACHTYSHCDSWSTAADDFEESIARNRRALKESFPAETFSSFSYPISEPRPGIKRVSGRHFGSCRASGQTFNLGRIDLNQLSSYFLEQAHGDLQAVQDLIDNTVACKGWLIFATHDVEMNPSRFGCTPDFFEAVVKYASESGATVLPVRDVLDILQNSGIARSRTTEAERSRSAEIPS